MSRERAESRFLSRCASSTTMYAHSYCRRMAKSSRSTSNDVINTSNFGRRAPPRVPSLTGARAAAVPAWVPDAYDACFGRLCC